MKKHERDLRELADAHGWTVELARSGHFRMSKPGLGKLTASASPRDKRNALRQIERDFRRRERGR